MIVAVLIIPTIPNTGRSISVSIYPPWRAIVYKITCNITGKSGYGKHKDYETFGTKYTTSTDLIKKSINKYGIENHTLEIIMQCMTEDDAYHYEGLLTPFEEIYPQNPMSLNLIQGGKGVSSKDVIGMKNPMYGKNRTGKNNGMYGKNHSDYSKSIIGIKNSKENHPQWGILGKKCHNYNHDISTQSIIDLMLQNTIKINKRLTQHKWITIAKKNNSIQCFRKGRIEEMNQILNSNCKTTEDVFHFIFKKCNISAQAPKKFICESTLNAS